MSEDQKMLDTLEEARRNYTELFCKLEALTNAARKLRSAQRWYMANRGNQEAGKAVAVAARDLDVVLGDA